MVRPWFSMIVPNMLSGHHLAINGAFNLSENYLIGWKTKARLYERPMKEREYSDELM
jgi:hypothetical protein